MSASGSQRPLVIGTRAPRTVRSQSVAASRIADRSVRTPRPRPIESTYCRRRALIRQIAAAEAAEIVSLVWACLVFPGFPSWNTSRLNRNLGIRNDRVSDARASFGYRALLFRIRGSILDVEQVSESSCLRDSARERIRQGNSCHSNPALPSSVRPRRRPNDTLQRTNAGRGRVPLATNDPAAPSRRTGAKLGLANQTPPPVGSRPRSDQPLKRLRQATP